MKKNILFFSILASLTAVSFHLSAQQEAAATKIQALWRGRKARMNLAAQQKKEAAATQIQAQFRGLKGRKRAAARRKAPEHWQKIRETVLKEAHEKALVTPQGTPLLPTYGMHVAREDKGPMHAGLGHVRALEHFAQAQRAEPGIDPADWAYRELSEDILRRVPPKSLYIPSYQGEIGAVFYSNMIPPNLSIPALREKINTIKVDILPSIKKAFPTDRDGNVLARVNVAPTLRGDAPVAIYQNEIVVDPHFVNKNDSQTIAQAINKELEKVSEHGGHDTLALYEAEEIRKKIGTRPRPIVPSNQPTSLPKLKMIPPEGDSINENDPKVIVAQEFTGKIAPLMGVDPGTITLEIGETRTGAHASKDEHGNPTIRFSPWFLKGFDENEIMQTVVHELGHVAGKHTLVPFYGEGRERISRTQERMADELGIFILPPDIREQYIRETLKTYEHGEKGIRYQPEDYTHPLHRRQWHQYVKHGEMMDLYENLKEFGLWDNVVQGQITIDQAIDTLARRLKERSIKQRKIIMKQAIEELARELKARSIQQRRVSKFARELIAQSIQQREIIMKQAIDELEENILDEKIKSAISHLTQLEIVQYVFSKQQSRPEDVKSNIKALKNLSDRLKVYGLENWEAIADDFQAGRIDKEEVLRFIESAIDRVNQHLNDFQQIRKKLPTPPPTQSPQQ